MEDRKKSQSEESNNNINSNNESTTLSKRYSHNTKNMHSSTIENNSEDQLIEKLTLKLAGHIRKEIKNEMKSSLHTEDIRETVADKMDSYLSAELNTHTCIVCNQLMIGIEKVPTILVPCGHTFCKYCVLKHQQHQQQYLPKTCPTCR